MHGVPNPSLHLTCEYRVQYERLGDSPLPWADFSNAMALAHVIPYLREFISNMTNRLPFPVLIIPPINTYGMIKEYEASLAAPS